MILGLNSVKMFQFKYRGEKMKIKELRLGNLLLRNNRTETVNRLSTTRINKNIASEYQGIEITKDWLLKYNFVLFSSDYYTLEDIISFSKDLSKIFILTDNTVEPIKYIHELQNLYYSLKRKELI